MEVFRISNLLCYLQVTPGCFDKHVKALHHHPVFQNRSSNMQMPIEEQLAIALYCFGHYGNAASTIKVALWAGVGYGTVHLVTHQIMQAGLLQGFVMLAKSLLDTTKCYLRFLCCTNGGVPEAYLVTQFFTTVPNSLIATSHHSSGDLTLWKSFAVRSR